MSDELATAFVTLRGGGPSGWIVVDDGDRVEIPPGYGALVVEDEDGVVEVSLLPLDLRRLAASERDRGRDVVTATAPRLARAEIAARLRDQGYSHEEIGERLGLRRSGVRNLLNDPDGSKQRARRERYRGTCEECGAATDGSNGRDAAPAICARCAAIRQHDERPWTSETILPAVAAANDVCVELLGRPLCGSDWTAGFDSQAPRLSERRIAESERLRAELDRRGLRLPHLSRIQREFGSWRECARRIGIPSAPRGTPSHRPRFGAAAVCEPSAFRPVRRVEAADADEVCPSCGEYVRVLDAATGWCRACVAAT